MFILLNPPTYPRPLRSHARSRRRGAAAVEFALVAPVFFVVILGIVEVARGFMVLGILENAARSGCRTGILQNRSNSDVNNAVTAALAGTGLTDTTTTIYVNGAAANVSTASTGDIIRVSVSIPTSKITWVPAIRYLRSDITASWYLPRG